MSLFVLDCSLAMSWCFEDESSDYSDGVLDSLKEGECLVPELWILEVSNVLLMAEKRKRLKKADSLRFVELLKALPITIDENSSFYEMESLLSTGREYGLTSYDARYLELAMRRGLPLATCDKALMDACRKSGVGVFQPA